MKIISIALFCFLSLNLSAQSNAKIEQELINLHSKLDYWTTEQRRQPEKALGDSLVKANAMFRKKLLQYTSNNPETINYAFTRLKKQGLYIADSKDGNFRIYSWDDLSGGTMRFFENVFQCKRKTKTGSTSFAGPDQNPGGFYSEIFTLENVGIKYYLAYFNAIGSNREMYQSLQTFKLTETGLQKNIKIIKTKTGLKSELGFGFDFFSVVDRPERPVKLIHFDPKAKTIKIPLVNDKGSGQVSDKFITYKFNGQYFVKI